MAFNYCSPDASVCNAQGCVNEQDDLNLCWVHISKGMFSDIVADLILSQYRGIVKEECLVIILGQFFLFLHKNICCWYSLEVPRCGASNEYPQRMFLWRTGENYPIIITKFSSLTIPLHTTNNAQTCSLFSPRRLK